MVHKPCGKQSKLVDLVFVVNGVSRVGSAAAHYEFGIISQGEVSNNLALAFPTVLSADYDSCCHKTYEYWLRMAEENI